MSSTNLVKKNLFTKPYLLTLDEISEIGQNMNLVGYDPQLNITSDDTNIVLKYGVASSPKILNWVEPYKIAGIDYTLFYTEVNSGLNIGDRVFIINGTYDSNLLIQTNKYKKGHDGYKVLFIDNCRVVLDIEFVGSLPSNETTKNNDDFDDFIKVYYLKDQNDFIHANRQITTRVSNGKVDFKFNRNQNNMVFTDSSFSAITDNWGKNNGLSGAPGFFIKNSTSSWINISSDFMTGSYSIAATSSNNKILILNNSFTYNGFEFKENSVYSWEYDTTTEEYSWLVNVKHENNNVPILTKSNFRNGSFNGTWNGGLYGSNDKRITWGSTTSYWNHGTLLNTIWEKGIMESRYSQLESYIAEFDKDDLPYQKSANSDNEGYGYNFIINSEIRNAIINNGNVSNSILLGTGTAASISIVEDHVKGNLTDQYIRDNFNSTLINKAYFESCGIQNANIENAIIKNSRVSNSRIYSVKSINTHYKSSLFKNSNYISDNIIKVLDFDEFEYSDQTSSSGVVNTTHLIYKFYINKRSYEKFKFKDNFYIKGIKLNYSVTNARFLETAPKINSILNFFDKKFKIGPWKEYVDVYDSATFSKAPIQLNSFISTAKENQYEHNVATNVSIINLTGDENKKGYSLDIFIKLDSTFLIENGLEKTVSYKNVIDFSNAYIQNSDFESGIVENSNWNSGSHINFNKKLNLVNSLNNDGEYDISLTQSTSLILNNINLNGTIAPNDEFDLDYLNVNDIIFLNAVDYDSRGIVTSITLTQSGAEYLTSNGITASYQTGNGVGLSLDIVANTIGGVLNPITYNGDGDGYGYSGLYSTSNISGSGLGSGLILNIIRDTGNNTLSSFIIDSIGQGYQIGDIVGVTTDGSPGTFRIDNVTNGEVINTSVSTGGLFYELGDVLNIETGNGLAKIQVTGITGSLTRLPDTYKVLNLAPFIVTEIVATGSTGILPGLTASGKFSSYGANNRYGYLHKTKFYKSKIVSGLFRRAYIKGSLIKNDSIDISDKDFINVEKLKSLMIVDSIFSKNDNILSNALYTFSSFVNGTDIWDNGILFRSIWNDMTFNNGLIKESTWLDGKFLNGLFYMSTLPSINVNDPFYNSNDVQSYYKSGSLLTDDNNDRFSWRKGTFVNGEFYKSKWEDGYFNGGKFYYSDFYDGEINGGIIGDKSISVSDTNVYNGTINYTTVENANLTANYTDTNKSVKNNINWYDGIFNGGKFSTFGTKNSNNTATWYNGTFNGGEFGPINKNSINTNIPKWKDGIFNGGKFTSVYGTASSGAGSGSGSGGAGIGIGNLALDYITSYAWENGTFNGGEFGNESRGYNSSWFNGIFNGGKFIGKVWNSGIFTFGEFSGSGKTQSGFYAIGGTVSSINSNANKFVKSFNGNNYYGLWRSGFVTDTKNRYLDQEIFTDLQRSSNTNKTLPFTLLKDMLWLSGTFSHPSATIQNSVWLDGTFENGTFKNSAFNPYVSRNNTNQTFNFSDSCIWTNGLFDSGEFSISKWKNGRFITGTATGMIWENGIANYMNAYNVFWEDGLWRNGNWQGSYYNISPDGSVTDPYVMQILERGMSWSGRDGGATSSCHIWSVFFKESLTEYSLNIIDPVVAGTILQKVDILEEDQSPLPPNQFGVIDAGSTPPSTDPDSPVSNKVLGSIAWAAPIGGTADRIGSDTSVSILFTGIDQYNSVTWEFFNGNDWFPTFNGGITLKLETDTFSILSGVNKFRVSGINPDNQQTDNTNELTYTFITPYTITGQSVVSVSNTPQQVQVQVSNQPVTLNLTAKAVAQYVYQTNFPNTVKGIAEIYLNGTQINGSPFSTEIASSVSPGTSTKVTLIVLPPNNNYNVVLKGEFTNGPFGTVTLT
jgi:hypothetical protein